MTFLSWTDELSVKIDSIDNQHKKLIDMLGDFYNNISNRSNKESISKLLMGMKNYTVMHFSTEEQYMKKFDYPEYEIHKKEHEQFVDKVKEIEEKFNSGKLVLTFEITMFLKDWLKKHILETDKKYSDFFIRHGIS